MAAAAGALLILAACKSAPPPAPPPKPIEAQLSVIAAADLNPNRAGRPSPVFLRVYQLRDGGKFLNAGFDEVTTKSDQVLAGAIVAREERMVQPGTTTVIALQLAPETRLLGVIAEYSDLTSSQWRASSQAPEGGLLTLFKDRSLAIRLDRQAVSVITTAAAKGK